MKPFFRFTSLACILTLASCSSAYLPNVPNTPMLSQKGEFSAAAHVSFKGNVNINGAYAVANHIGLIAGGSAMNYHSESKDLKHRNIEIGGGYFTTFGSNKARILEVYAGVGKGSSDMLFRDFDKDVLVSSELQEVDYRKTFIQLNFSSDKNNHLKLFGANIPISYGTALRLTNAKMDRMFLNSVVQPKESNIFFEPVFFTRMALSKNFQLQYTTSTTIGLQSRKYLNAGNSIFTIGAVLNLGNKPH
ncbi:hypothetical protein [Pedobacter sp. MW01-1-1]|uniref:hypothetical protein n=1 Tax=Pedobacter sp. MW01-1-1 TaxID=3383027 RepID=UPI003FEFB206